MKELTAASGHTGGAVKTITVSNHSNGKSESYSLTHGKGGEWGYISADGKSVVIFYKDLSVGVLNGYVTAKQTGPVALVTPPLYVKRNAVKPSNYVLGQPPLAGLPTLSAS
jgi:hypothetical protein